MKEAKKASLLQRAAIEIGKYSALAGTLFSAGGCASVLDGLPGGKTYNDFHVNLLTLKFGKAFEAPYKAEGSALGGTLKLAEIIAVDTGLAFLIGGAGGGDDGHDYSAPAGPGPTPADPF